MKLSNCLRTLDSLTKSVNQVKPNSNIIYPFQKLNNLCACYNERDYYIKKLKQYQVSLEILTSSTKNKCLPDKRDRKSNLPPEDKLTTCSSVNKPHAKQNKVIKTTIVAERTEETINDECVFSSGGTDEDDDYSDFDLDEFLEPKEKNRKGPIQEKTNNLMEDLTTRMQELAINFLPSLISKNLPKTKRAKHVINLGITDQKVHQDKRTSICGNQGLSLILTWTNTTHIHTVPVLVLVISYCFS